MSSKPISKSFEVNEDKRTGRETITEKDIAWLWMAMTKAYGYKFVRNYGEKDNGIWFDGLKNLTAEDLVYGFRKALSTTNEEERSKGEAWPPNLKELRMFCERRLKDFGLPTAGKAFDEIEVSRHLSNPHWSHPIVRRAMQFIDANRFDGNRYYLFREFKEVYEEFCQHYMRGAGLSQMMEVGDERI